MLIRLYEIENYYEERRVISEYEYRHFERNMPEGVRNIEDLGVYEFPQGFFFAYGIFFDGWHTCTSNDFDGGKTGYVRYELCDGSGYFISLWKEKGKCFIGEDVYLGGKELKKVSE